MFHDLVRAKRAWETDSPSAGYAALVDLLAKKGVEAPFSDADFLLQSSVPGRFEMGVRNLLTATLPNSARTVLQVPLARPWSVLFRADPDQGLIDLLLRYDFAPTAGQVGFDESPHAPPPHAASDLARIVDALTDAARAGWLSPDPADRMFGGRAVLTLDQVEQASDWGELESLVHTGLTAAYADAPADPWAALLERDAAVVAERFTFDLVGRNNSPPASVAGRWRAVKARRPAYAEAGIQALKAVLDGDPARAETVVTLIAGKPEQHASWLSNWVHALEHGDGAPPA